VLCAILLLSACDVPLPFGGGSTAPHRGGSIVDALRVDAENLIPGQDSDGVDVAIDSAIWAPLWYGDATGALHPGLAREVPSQQNGDVSADLTTWTIHLKPNLKWSDGSPLTADDVAFSLNTFANPHFANTNGFPLNDPRDPIDFLGATRVDATTVRFILAHAYEGMAAILADGLSAPLPLEVFGTMNPGDIPKSHEGFFPTVSSGPFKVSEHIPGDRITVERNPYYYQGPDKPYLDQITFKRFPSLQAVLEAAQAGLIDTAYGTWSGVTPLYLQSYRALAGYNTYFDPYPNGYEWILFNLNNPILKDKVVRQALALSLDPKQIIAQDPSVPLAPTCDDHAGTFAHEPNLTCYPQDPARARQLLDDDGWMVGTDGYRHKDGKTLELTYRVSALQINHPRDLTAVSVPKIWAAIGAKIDVISNYTFPDYFHNILPSGGFDIAEYGSNTSYDPDDHANFMCDQTPDKGGYNYMHYCNPSVDQAEIAQQSTTDEAKRIAAFQTIHRAILDDLPVMYYYTGLSVGFYRSTLHNYKPFATGLDLWNSWEWYLDQG
jgi:peptide/nickel transport system substrate-binding protein